MVILVVANNDGGLWSFRRDLLMELVKRNEVYFSVPSGDYVTDIEEIGCKYVPCRIDRRGINPKADFALFRQYKRLIKNINPDLVITYTIKPNIYGGIASRIANKTYAVNITGLGTAFNNSGLVRTLVVNLYKYALKKAKVIFFENSSNRDELISLGCCNKDQTVVLNGAGVNTEYYFYQSYPNNDAIKFLFVGRVMKEKGIDELIHAMKYLIQDGINCSLDVVGPYEENYADKFKPYEEAGWLQFHGRQSDVRPFIAACDCFVLPSYHEGMANTNLECAASGRPIITSNIPGCKEAVTKDSGLLCEPKNTKSLYRTMKKMVELTRDEREQMGRAGRKHMEDMFDKKKVVAETIQYLF